MEILLDCIFAVGVAPEVKKAIFNDPATIVFWSDGTKTVVMCGKDDKYDPEKGLAMAFCKKVMGNSGRYYKMFKDALPQPLPFRKEDFLSTEEVEEDPNIPDAALV